LDIKIGKPKNTYHQQKSPIRSNTHRRFFVL